MATAARTAPSFEVTAPPDIMDIHSDSGLDFDGEDIDLELRSPGHFDMDDDVSLKDAATDGLDIHTTTADQDDFMADNEDLIDEDVVSYDDAVPTEHSMMDGEPEPEMTNAEEDLLDYSDEEDEATAVEPVEAALPSTDAAVSESKEQLVLPTPPTVDPALVEDSSHAHVLETNLEEEITEETEQSFQDESYQESLQPANDDYQHVDQHQENEEHNEHELYADEDAAQSEVIEPASALEQPNEEAKSPASAHGETVQTAAPDQSPDVGLHPVTINYDGAELWLFKHHDYESSGDYLIEESSLADKPISSVIEACRAALGSDVTDDIELGFRLDNFHNIELYQDHSSCAFVTLEHIVGVYLRLHSQDGVSDPESFYMTLLSRPRVHALLNTLNEAAEKGIGHVGLNKDIAAGLTSFTAQLTHESTSYDDWENEEQEQEQEHDAQATNDAVAVKEHYEASFEESKDDSGEQDAGEQDGGEHVGEAPLEQQQETEEIEPNVLPEVELQSAKNEVVAETAGDFLGGDDKAPQADEESAQAVVHQSPSRGSHYSDNEPDKSDIIDYSDDEDDGEDSPGAQTQPVQPSSASSTVQGDNTSYVQETANQEYAENEEEVTEVTQDYEGNDAEGDFTHYENFEESFDDQAYGGEYLEANDDALVQQYTEALGEEPSGVSPAADEDNTNYNHEAGDQSVDQLAEETVDVDDGSYDTFQDLTGDDAFPGADVFLDFENADATADAFTYEQAEGFTENNEFSHDNEDGVDSQAPAAASTGAEPVVASSSEPLVTSPQGQKRTIDEVGNDVGEATDSSDAKRPRV